MEHIASAFDKDLDTLNALLMRLGTLAINQLAAAMATYRAGDDAEIDTIIATDKELDALEVELNAKAVELIARRAPMAQDLRRIIAVLKVASALERVGDYAKNIAKRTRVILEHGAPPEDDKLISMGALVGDMLRDVMQSYVDVDADLAMRVRDRDVEVDEIHTNLFRTLLTQMDAETGDLSVHLHCLFIAKNIERMGDYATSIAEQVYFLKMGQLPDDARPKADKSSTSG